MGIINLTPDSFYEPSRADALSAPARIREMVARGVSIIDIGAVSTRPGAPDVPLEEEWRRLRPVLEGLARSGILQQEPGGAFSRAVGAGECGCVSGAAGAKVGCIDAVGAGECGCVSDEGAGGSGADGAKVGCTDAAGAGMSECVSGADGARAEGERPRSPVPPLRISVDTTRAEIVRRVYNTIGPFIVNDISAGEDDPGMLPLVAELGLSYIAMHKRGTPSDMDSFCSYGGDVVQELLEYFSEFSRKAASMGISDWILDPGLGFAKTPAQCWEILERLSEFKVFGRPVLIGAADKRFTRQVPPHIASRYFSNAIDAGPLGDEHEPSAAGGQSGGAPFSPELDGRQADGTDIAHALALAHGADILRVHRF